MKVNFFSGMLCSLLIGLSAFAGDKVGNSCKTIICFSDASVLKEILAPELRGTPSYGLIRDQDISKIVSIETLDLHEARLEDLRFPGRGQIFEMKEGESEWEWVERVKARFSAVFPYINKLIPPSKELFDQILIANQSVAPVDDARSAWVYEPSSCTTVTTALQRRIGDLGRIQLDGRLYRHTKMSSLSRGVMMLHEALYFVQLNRFHLPPPPEPENSAPTRALIGFLIQKDLRATPTVGALIAEIRKLGFKMPWADIHPLLGVDFQRKGLDLMEALATRLGRKNLETPFYKFRETLRVELARKHGLYIPLYPNFAALEKSLESAYRHSAFFAEKECLQWEPTLRCFNWSETKTSINADAKKLIKSFIDQIPNVKKTHQSEFPRIKEKLTQDLDAAFRKDFPESLFENNGHRPALNAQLKLFIERLYREFWIDAVFKGDALNAEEFTHFKQTRIPNLLTRDTVDVYQAAKDRVYELIAAQAFEENP